jgi:hypothetical protein
LKVAILDPNSGADFGFEAFRRHVRRRLHLLEPLRYKLVGAFDELRSAAGILAQAASTASSAE